MNLLFAGTYADWNDYRDLLPAALARHGLKADLHHGITCDAPEDIDYIIYAPSSGLRDFTPFTRAKAVLSLWAGVETIVTNESLTQPLARMVDPGLTEGMVEWCLGHLLRHHLGFDRDICRRDQIWAPYTPKIARERVVTVLGLGALGRAVAGRTAGLGFQTRGWSRSPGDVAGVACYSGEDGLADALKDAEILILLLPLTRATEDLINGERLAHLARGAVVINPGRGPLIDDAALLDALDQGQLSHATLDVFREEPLPQTHTYWTHDKVTVTPHVAASTRAVTAVEVLVENIRRGEAGEDFLHLVDRGEGY